MFASRPAQLGRLVLVAATTFLLVAPLTAESALYDMRLGGSAQIEVGGGTFGNERTFFENGDSVTATAWATVYPSPPNTFSAAYLAQYATGLGNCNQEEAALSGGLSNCVTDGGNRDQVDNVGRNDFVLFVFSSVQQLDAITIDPFGVFDRDVTWWVGTVGGPLSLSGLTLADLPGLGFGPEMSSFNGISGDPLTISLGGVSGNALLFAALYPPNGDADKFKIQSIATNGAQIIPVPAAVWLLGSALGVLGWMRRRPAG